MGSLYKVRYTCTQRRHGLSVLVVRIAWAVNAVVRPRSTHAHHHGHHVKSAAFTFISMIAMKTVLTFGGGLRGPERAPQ